MGLAPLFPGTLQLTFGFNMKRYLLALGLLAAWACQGANPSFSDFSTNSFSTTGNSVDVKPAVGFRFATRFTPSQAQMYFEGDSLTGGAQAWWFWLSNNFQRYQNFKRWVNYAHSGDTVDMTTNQWPTEMGTNTLAVGELGVAWYWIGANGPHGLQNYDPAEPQADMRWWTTNTQAKGYEVGWITILPQAYVSDDQTIQFEANRQIMNNYMRTSSLPQYLVDAAALFPNPFDTNFYRWGAGDTGVHLNTNAQAILADEVDRALRGWPRAGGAYAPPKVWQQVTTNYVLVDQAGSVLQRVDPSGRLFPNSVSVGTSNTITLGSDGVLTFLGLGSGGLVWRIINSGYGTVFYFGPDGSMFIGPNDASGGIQLYPNGQITAGGRLHIIDDALFDGGTIYTTVAAPLAATIGGSVGSVTNHMLLNVGGKLMDYWSDGTSLYSKQLAP